MFLLSGFFSVTRYHFIERPWLEIEIAFESVNQAARTQGTKRIAGLKR